MTLEFLRISCNLEPIWRNFSKQIPWKHKFHLISRNFWSIHSNHGMLSAKIRIFLQKFHFPLLLLFLFWIRLTDRAISRSRSDNTKNGKNVEFSQVLDYILKFSYQFKLFFYKNILNSLWLSIFSARFDEKCLKFCDRVFCAANHFGAKTSNNFVWFMG